MTYLYIVEASGGEYGNAWNQVKGVFSSNEKAENAILNEQIRIETLIKTLPLLKKQAEDFKNMREPNVNMMEALKQNRIKLCEAEDAEEPIDYDIIQFELDADLFKPI